MDLFSSPTEAKSSCVYLLDYSNLFLAGGEMVWNFVLCHIICVVQWQFIQIEHKIYARIGLSPKQ
jgi:hypothetical protein